MCSTFIRKYRVVTLLTPSRLSVPSFRPLRVTSHYRGVVRYFTGRVPSSQWRGSKCELPLPPIFFTIFTPILLAFEWWFTQNQLGVVHFCDFFFFWRVLALIRTGAWHPLLNLSGCLGTRGTRSNDGPAITRPFYLFFIKLAPHLNAFVEYPFTSCL